MPSFVINHFFFGHLHGNLIIERSCLLLSEQVFEKRSSYLEWQVLVLTDYSNLASGFPKMNKLCLSKSAKRFLFDCLY